MSLKPEYSVDIIVLIKFNGKYAWYLQEKEYWVLDYNKWESTSGSLGDDDIIYSEDLRRTMSLLRQVETGCNSIKIFHYNSGVFTLVQAWDTS